MAPGLQAATDFGIDLSQLPSVIGVYAPSGRSGKGTVADTLIQSFGYRRIQFSRPIKAMFEALALYAGMTADEIARALDGDLKETPLPQLGGVSLRQFGEVIGNDVGREVFGRDFWLNLAKPRVDEALKQGFRIVMDDMRYPNEAEYITSLGGIVVSVSRPDENGGRGIQWQSEGRLSDSPFDLTFLNDGTVQDLQWKVFRDLIEYSRKF